MTGIVTTERKELPVSIELAEKLARDLGILYVQRRKKSFARMLAENNADAMLVAYPQDLRLHTAAGEMFFHPSMSQLRLKNLRNGEGDHMAEAMALQPGMSVLDCTLGLGTDAIVAAFVTGEKGSVTGVESSPYIAAVTVFGLQHFVPGNYPLYDAMRRIQVVNADYLDFLRQQKDNSFDVVYFDPMFRQPVLSSSSISPLRSAANKNPLSLEAVAEACRVARQRVVMKEKQGSGEFARLGFNQLAGGKYSSVQYGIKIVE